MVHWSTADTELATMAHALGHPARVKLLRRLAIDGAAEVKILVKHMGLAQSTVSEHLRFLREAGLVTALRKGRQVRYSVSSTQLRHFLRLASALAVRLGP